jgi:magnesium transporter
MPRTRLYCNGQVKDSDFPLSEISEHLATDDALVWVDLCAPDAADLELVAQELGLHALAVEDAMERHQRPKLDRYASHDFLSAYSVHLDAATGELQTAEISAFITDNALITVRRTDQFSIDGIIDRWEALPELLSHGVGALVYGLLDFVVDGHFDAVQSLDEEIEKLEDLLFDDRWCSRCGRWSTR